MRFCNHAVDCSINLLMLYISFEIILVRVTSLMINSRRVKELITFNRHNIARFKFIEQDNVVD